MIYGVAIISIILGSVGQFILKLAAGELKTGSGILRFGLSMINLKMMLAIACFVISMLMWVMVLRKLELSIAYPMISMGYVFVMFLSYYFLQEQLYLTKVLGTGLIVAGVIVLNIR